MAPSLDGVFAYVADATTRGPLARVKVQSGAVERRLGGLTLGGIAEVIPGSLIFANAGQNRIESYDWATGARAVLAGSPANASGFRDGAGTSARFSAPSALARSPDGAAVYVVDQSSRAVVRRVDLASGAVQCWVGDRDTAGAPCRFPNAGGAVFAGLAVSADGEALIAADVNNSRVLSFRSATSAVEALAGGPQAGYADGAAAAALFSQPAGLSVSPDGQLLVVSETVQPGAGSPGQFPRLRAVTACPGDPCPFGQWLGPCNAAFRGRCVNCSLPAQARYMAPSSPYNRDACPWVCLDVSCGSRSLPVYAPFQPFQVPFPARKLQQ